MTTITWQLLTTLALAGYGDAVDGRPSHAEREVHFWTNAVRVDPGAFSGDYPCSFSSFSSSESSPKAPLYHHPGLNEVAWLHSDDMNRDGYFDHDSNDGTSWSSRIYAYYDGGTIGENIAYGYSSPFSAVIEGWMCSGGHRANIMSTSFDEMGTGVSGTYYTQDFGGGPGPDRAMAMGLHLPANPGSTVQFGVDWALNEAPDDLFVVLDGERIELAPFVGEQSGWSAWSAEASVGGGCHEYYFVGELDGRTETFPEDGSYGWGGCAFDDDDAGWLDGQLPWDEEGDDDSTDDGTDDDGTDDDDGPSGDDDDDTDGADDDDDSDGDDDEDDQGDPGDEDEDDERLSDYRSSYGTGGCSVVGQAATGWLVLLSGLMARRRR